MCKQSVMLGFHGSLGLYYWSQSIQHTITMTDTYIDRDIHLHLTHAVKQACAKQQISVEEAHSEHLSFTARNLRISQHPQYAATWIVEADLPGEGLNSNMTIFGGIHGDEPAGIWAIEQLLLELVSGERALDRGRLTLSVINEKGAFVGERHGNSSDEDMNRLFSDSLISKDPYVSRRMEEAKKLIQESSALLDLHTTSAPSPAFAVTEPRNSELARKMPVPFVLELAEATHIEFLTNTSCFYAADYHVPGLIVECGQHNEHQSKVQALSAARAFLELCAGKTPESEPKNTKLLQVAFIHAKKLSDLIPQNSIEFSYARDFENFEILPTGTLIATETAMCGPFQQEISYRATEDCYICLPSKYEKQKADDYVFMLATDTSSIIAEAPSRSSSSSLSARPSAQ